METNRDRGWTRIDAKQKTDGPQMDPPSLKLPPSSRIPETMAGKLQIYADGFFVGRCLACEADKAASRPSKQKGRWGDLSAIVRLNRTTEEVGSGEIFVAQGEPANPGYAIERALRAESASLGRAVLWSVKKRSQITPRFPLFRSFSAKRCFLI